MGETYSIRREIDTSRSRLQVEHCADEGRILMRETIVFLSGPGTGFDVIDRGKVGSPLEDWGVSSCIFGIDLGVETLPHE